MATSLMLPLQRERFVYDCIEISGLCQLERCISCLHFPAGMLLNEDDNREEGSNPEYVLKTF